jgi:hypothetical protein
MKYILITLLTLTFVSVLGAFAQAPTKENDQRLKIHELVKKMRQTTNNNERRAIIKEIREYRRKNTIHESPEDRNSKRTVPQRMDQAQLVSSSAINHTVEKSQCYEIPFSSNKNRIELTVANTSISKISNVSVERIDLPEWVHVTPELQTISSIEANTEKEVTFTFSIDKAAPVKKEQTLTFKITSQTGEQWTKQIKIIITAPDKFELFQNYPNPFNPTTKIEYQLPNDGLVSLKVYNLLGEEIATLVNEQQEVGYRSVEWKANQVSSGIYFYRLQCGSYSSLKRMMVVK